MTKYLISFPSEAMVLSEADLEAAGRDSRAVIAAAKAAGVYVFAGGINEGVEPVKVAADGAISAELYPGSQLAGGFAVFELPNREAAVIWASRLAAACRCDQELREFMYDPAS
ncbi:MAG: transcription initiation protein [Sphingomonas sp.]|nr:transcription initiation protein [Sphingomonas sp.]